MPASASGVVFGATIATGDGTDVEGITVGAVVGATAIAGVAVVGMVMAVRAASVVVDGTGTIAALGICGGAVVVTFATAPCGAGGVVITHQLTMLPMGSSKITMRYGHERHLPLESVPDLDCGLYA